MMKNIHLAATEEDDLYSGYNEHHPSLQTQDLEQDEGFQQALKTSYGRRPTGTATRIGTGFRAKTSGHSRTAGSGLSTGRMGTSLQDPQALTRPMTAVRGAGYTSSGNRTATSPFDPLKMSGQNSSSPLPAKEEDTPMDKVQQLEAKLHRLIEESNIAAQAGQLKVALEKAREGAAKERQLVKMRDLAETPHNWDLTYSILLNLALQYAANEMYTEALNAYQIILKNKKMINSGRLKVNIGNIYYKQGNYNKAIKFYRMALDKVPNTHKEMRMRIMQNIGLVFVKMGQYTDAITSFDYIMSDNPNYKTGLHLLLCYYALGDKEEMKKSFLKLLEITNEVEDEDKYVSNTDDRQMNLIIDVIKNDSLQQIEKKKKQEGEQCILTAAKLIAPAIADSFTAGYNWCVEEIQISAYAELANDLEINKAVTFLRQKQFNLAIDTLRSFEKKETKVASTAATNLSFLYLLQNDIELAEKYADKAILADRFNAGGLVNKGNCAYLQGDVDKAKSLYQEAINNDSSCVEALYNIGLANKKLGHMEEALNCFNKLHTIVRNNPLIVYQIANLYELLGDHDQSMEWYLQVVGLVPTDPNLLAKIGEMFDNDGDRMQAYQYHYDSFRYFPSNIEVIEWLGAYYIEAQLCEKAIGYFERAAILQPNQVNWQLMVASCHRRSGNYQQALQTYKSVHRKFPENIECLKFLVRICGDMGLKEVTDYSAKLKKAEKAQVLKEQRANSGSRPGSRRSSGKLSRDSSASSNMSVPLGSPTHRRTSSRGSYGANSAANSGRNTSVILPESDEPYDMTSREIDASYSDPLGPQAERPRTAARKLDDDFDNEELGDDLLPQ